MSVSMTMLTIAAAGFVATQSTGADRSLVHEAIIDAPIEEVWRAFTDESAMLEWMVARAEVDLRVGGAMRTSYMPGETLDDEHTIVNEIISLDPPHMLSMRNVRAPKAFENAHLFQRTWSVVYFDAISPDQTKVRSVGHGYGEGEQWDDVYTKFETGNTYVFQMLQQYLGGDPATIRVNPDPYEPVTPRGRPEMTQTLLDRFVGGAWIHDGTASDGRPFRVRNVIKRGPSVGTFIMDGKQGDSGDLHDHAATQVWREPGSGRFMFQSLDEMGAVVHGEIWASDEQTLVWDWQSTAPNGERAVYRIETRFTGPDSYRMHLFAKTDGELEEVVNITFKRVNEEG